MLPWSWAVERLERARNYWISTTREDGRPHAMPVWGVVHQGSLWFGSGGVKAENLARTGRLVAHTESGDDVVILEGRAETADVSDELRDAYEAKYDFRPEQAQMWVVRPTLAFAWRQAGRQTLPHVSVADGRSAALRHDGEPRQRRGSGHL